MEETWHAVSMPDGHLGVRGWSCGVSEGGHVPTWLWCCHCSAGGLRATSCDLASPVGTWRMTVCFCWGTVGLERRRGPRTASPRHADGVLSTPLLTTDSSGTMIPDAWGALVHALTDACLPQTWVSFHGLCRLCCTRVQSETSGWGHALHVCTPQGKGHSRRPGAWPAWGQDGSLRRLSCRVSSRLHRRDPLSGPPGRPTTPMAGGLARRRVPLRPGAWRSESHPCGLEPPHGHTAEGQVRSARLLLSVSIRVNWGQCCPSEGFRADRRQ